MYEIYRIMIAGCHVILNVQSRKDIRADGRWRFSDGRRFASETGLCTGAQYESIAAAYPLRITNEPRRVNGSGRIAFDVFRLL